MVITERRESMPTRSHPGSMWLSAVVTSLGGGLLGGVPTNLAQGWLPGGWNQLANSGVVRSVLAFVAGSVVAGRVVGRTAPAVAAIAGLCAELGLVIGYYMYAEFGFGRSGAGTLVTVAAWLVMACLAVPLFGLAVARWEQRAAPRSGRRGGGRCVRRRGNGVAGPPATAGPSDGRGLAGMRKRLAMVGARLDVHDDGEAGHPAFTVTAWLPVPPGGGSYEPCEPSSRPRRV